LSYVVVTQEDDNSNVHALLFSFPTTDKTLVDRYRQGEYLQPEEVARKITLTALLRWAGSNRIESVRVDLDDVEEIFHRRVKIEVISRSVSL